jgi:hypothetical protein
MDEWIVGYCARAINPKIHLSIHPFPKEKPPACLRRPAGTKPNSEERQR